MLRFLALVLLVIAHAFVSGAHEKAASGLICSPGSRIGECIEPQGVATDSETGEVFAADSGNDRIDAFNADGEDPFAFGEAEIQTWVAVDNWPDSPSRHSVYTSSLGYEVQKYSPDGALLDSFAEKGRGRCQLMRTIDPIGVGPGGQVDVVDAYEVRPEAFVNRIEQWDPEGRCEGEIRLFSGNQLVRNFTVDSRGNFYMTVAGAGGAIRKFSPAGKLLFQVGKETTTEGLAVGPREEIFAKQGVLNAAKTKLVDVITEYDRRGRVVRRFDYSSRLDLVQGMSPARSASRALVVSRQHEGVRYTLVPEGPAILRAPCHAKPDGATGAVTLESEIDPQGRNAKFHFVYVLGKHRVTTPRRTLSGSPRFELQRASEGVSELKPGATYKCWVVAGSSGSRPVKGEVGSFVAPPSR